MTRVEKKAQEVREAEKALRDKQSELRELQLEQYRQKLEQWRVKKNAPKLFSEGNSYIRNDYCGISTERAKFYYGYESDMILCGKYKEYRDNDLDQGWGFVALVGGKTVFSAKASQLFDSHEERFDVALGLMRGIEAMVNSGAMCFLDFTAKEAQRA